MSPAAGTTWVALLRGINLGKQKRVAMADLRALLDRLGYRDVRTVLQSGNAVFTAKGRAPAIEDAIASAIEAELRLDVTVIVRRASEFHSVVEANPFVAAGVDTKELHALFLSTKPSAKAMKTVDPEGHAPDEFAFGDRVVYLRLPNGIMGSKLPDFEKTLGVRATQRNWNTVTKLDALVGD